jgi:hypothetical protein
MTNFQYVVVYTELLGIYSREFRDGTKALGVMHNRKTSRIMMEKVLKKTLLQKPQRRWKNNIYVCLEGKML